MLMVVLNKYLVDVYEVGYDYDYVYDSGGNIVFGFWFYLMIDCVLFVSVFVIYVVLVYYIVGGFSGKDIFELFYVLVEIVILLVFSCIYGLVMFFVYKGVKGQVIVWFGVIFLFGVVFIGMEINEFYYLIVEGFGLSCSVFLLFFFILVGMYGLYVSVGLLWMLVLMVQIWICGFIVQNNIWMMCLSLFWYFFDIVWICVFIVVYLMGVL